MSNISRHQAGTKQAGVSVGGQFAAHEQSQAAGSGLGSPEPASALPMLSPSQLEKIANGEDVSANVWGEDDADMSVYQAFEKHLEAMPDWELQLTDIAYDDQLHGEQIDAYLSGDFEELVEIEENFYDDKCERSERIAGEILERMGVEDPECADSDLIDALAEKVRDYDTSDIVGDLAKNTHPQLMRAPVSQEDFGESSEKNHWLEHNKFGYTHDELYNGAAERSVDARAAYITDYLQRAGVDVHAFTPEDKENIRFLASDGPYYWHEGVRLDAIWHGDIQDAAASDEGRTVRLGGAPVHSRENQAGRTHLVLLDSFNGSGMDASLSTPLTVTLTPDRSAMLDSGGSAPGYGWDDTAGVVKSAYGVNVENVSRSAYDPQKYARDEHDNFTKQGAADARRDIEAELAQHRLDLRRRDEHARRHPEEDLTDEQVDAWNAVHDRVRELESARFYVAVDQD